MQDLGQIRTLGELRARLDIAIEQYGSDAEWVGDSYGYLSIFDRKAGIRSDRAVIRNFNVEDGSGV